MNLGSRKGTKVTRSSEKRVDQGIWGFFYSDPPKWRIIPLFCYRPNDLKFRQDLFMVTLFEVVRSFYEVFCIFTFQIRVVHPPYQHFLGLVK